MLILFSAQKQTHLFNVFWSVLPKCVFLLNDVLKTCVSYYAPLCLVQAITQDTVDLSAASGLSFLSNNQSDQSRVMHKDNFLVFSLPPHACEQKGSLWSVLCLNLVDLISFFFISQSAACHLHRKISVSALFLKVRRGSHLQTHELLPHLCDSPFILSLKSIVVFFFPYKDS